MSKTLHSRVKFIEQTVIAVANAALTLSKLRHSQRLLRLTIAATQTLTLPKATGEGGRYRIYVGITATGNKIIKANGTDIIQGMADISATTSGAFGTAANTNTITLNGTTTGGIRGTQIELQDVASGEWAVAVYGVGSGTAATCFSNT